MAPMSLGPRSNDVWGASAAGRVVAVGEGVPDATLGSQVAIYRSLRPTVETVGLWCERAHVHHLCCLALPDHVSARDYSGSLVNVMTAYAFLRQAAEEGHGGIVATAGGSATGRALAALARRCGVAVIHLVRSTAAREALRGLGMEHVLATEDGDFDDAFATLARDLAATAVFDGLGGAIVGRLAALLPQDATFHFYGFLDGATPISMTTLPFMARNLTMKRFSNFQSPTVRDPRALAEALADLRDCIEDPLFRTRIGETFPFDDIEAAMRHEAVPGAKAVLLA